MPSSGIYRMTLTWNISGQFGQSIFHWHFDDSGFATSEGAAHALLDAWLAANSPTFAGFYPGSTSLLSLKGRLEITPGGFEAFEPLGTPLAGTRVGSTSTSAPSPCAIFYPLDTSRKRGRWFIPGISDDDIVDGKYTAGYK